MKKFSFSLQVLLNLRARKEEKAKLALGDITGKCNQLDRELEILAKERSRAIGMLDNEPGGAFGRSLELRSRYLLKIDDSASRLQKQRAALELEREKAAAEYREAHRDLMVLRRLREGQEAQHRRSNARDEQKDIDDIAGSRHSSIRLAEETT